MTSISAYVRVYMSGFLGVVVFCFVLLLIAGFFSKLIGTPRFIEEMTTITT